MGELLLGCSGWNYGDTPENGGWTGVFYPDAQYQKAALLFRIFRYGRNKLNILREILYRYDQGNLHWHVQSNAREISVSVKVPETITHVKRMRIDRGAFSDFEEFLDKISPP